MLSLLTFVLLFPVSLFARPLGVLDKQRPPATCVIADVSYSDPKHTFTLLTNRAITPPVGLSERTFGELLIWCHEFGRSTSGLLLARQDTPSNCTPDSATQGGSSTAASSASSGTPSTDGGDAGPSATSSNTDGTGNANSDGTTASDPNSTSSTSAQGDGGSAQSTQPQAPSASGDGISSTPASSGADSQSPSSPGSGPSPDTSGTQGTGDGTTTTSSTTTPSNPVSLSNNQGCPPGTVLKAQGQVAGVFICVSV